MTLELHQTDIEAILDTISIKMDIITNFKKEDYTEEEKNSFLNSYQRLGNTIHNQLQQQLKDGE